MYLVGVKMDILNSKLCIKPNSMRLILDVPFTDIPVQMEDGTYKLTFSKIYVDIDKDNAHLNTQYDLSFKTSDDELTIPANRMDIAPHEFYNMSLVIQDELIKCLVKKAYNHHKIMQLVKCEVDV